MTSRRTRDNGRGGASFLVDIKIARRPTSRGTRENLSRSGDRAIFLIDLSTLGTTLNGRHVPRGYDEVDGTARERRRDAAA
jgi:hypothetical protein